MTDHQRAQLWWIDLTGSAWSKWVAHRILLLSLALHKVHCATPYQMLPWCQVRSGELLSSVFDQFGGEDGKDDSDDGEQGDGPVHDGLDFESLLWIGMTDAVFYWLGRRHAWTRSNSWLSGLARSSGLWHVFHQVQCLCQAAGSPKVF